MSIGGEKWIPFPAAAKPLLGGGFAASSISTAGRMAQGKSAKPSFGREKGGQPRLMYGNTNTYRANQLGFQPTSRYAELEVDHINGDYKDNRLCNRQFLLHKIHTQKTKEDAARKRHVSTTAIL